MSAYAERRPDVAALAATVLTCALMLLLVAAPVYTDDIWWHLAAGEHYLREGLWPTRDPLLHTGLEDGPVQHEWLFGALVHVVNEAGGFHALRALHLALAALIVLALWRAIRQRGASVPAASVLVSTFVLLAWARLEQLRPDLISILATVVVFGASLRPIGQIATGRWVFALAVLFVVWANMHSLFLVGVNLMIAATLGALLHLGIARVALPRAEQAQETPRAARHAVTLLLVIAVALIVAGLNPRGFAHHLTFLTSTAESAIWHVTDEWSHFNPLRWRDNHSAVSWQSWAGTNAVYALFALSAAVRLRQLVRDRTRAALERFDCIGFGLGLAAMVATLVSIRFMWMGFLPLAYVLIAHDVRPRRAVAWMGAALCVVMLLAFLVSPGVHNLFARYAAAPGDYLRMGYASHKYHAEGVHFLRATGLEGRLFNRYEIGGFLGYWLAPRLRTFIDARAEHYPYRVYLDFSSIVRMRTTAVSVEWLELLDKRDVDVYFGTGFAGWWRARNTTEDLRNMPGWRLVYRSYRTGIYLRVNDRNRRNLDRVADFYRREGVPFDPNVGFDVSRVIAARPDWAAANALLPHGFDAMPRAQRSVVLALIGAYEPQVANERAIIAARPQTRRARARLVHSLLRLDRPEEAAQAADALAQIADTPLSDRIRGLVQRYRRHRGTQPLETLPARTLSRLNRMLRRSSPIDGNDAWPVEYQMRTEGYPLTRATNR